MPKTNTGLIEYARAQLGRPYWWGTFGQIASGSLYASKKKQYPSYYTAGDFGSQYGKRVHDCIGLIKGYLWSDSPTSAPTYVASQDKSAAGMYAASSVKGMIGTFDYVPGRLLYKRTTSGAINHVGVYEGGGYVIEAKGHAYGVVRTPFRPAEWAFWSQCPYIQADVSEGSAADFAAPKAETMNFIDISDVQWKNGLRDIVAFVKANNIDGVIIKCSRAASSVNDSFKPWADALTAAGIPWMAYHFLNNDEKAAGAVKEADYFCDQVEPYLGTCALALDYEGKDMGFAVGAGYAKAFLDRVRERTGVTPLIYAQQSMVHTLTEICKAGYPLWVAAYASEREFTDFEPDQTCSGISSYKEAAIFQYTSNMHLKGYSGDLDADVFYGSIEDWKKLTGESEVKVMVNVAASLPELRKGCTGKAVKVMQTILLSEGFTLSTDGVFGAHTDACVRQWQSVHKLSVDGIVGAKTWKAMLEVL